MITGKVVSVADGDTITVLDADKTQHKIRLNGIDAPEKALPFGQRSKQSLSDLVFGKTNAAWRGITRPTSWSKRWLIVQLIQPLKMTPWQPA